MKKWKIISFITTIILALTFVYLIIDAIYCMTLSYPQMMLGIDVYNWLELFETELFLFMIIFGAPLLIDIILPIISIVKLRNKNIIRNEK